MVSQCDTQVTPSGRHKASILFWKQKICKFYLNAFSPPIEYLRKEGVTATTETTYSVVNECDTSVNAAPTSIDDAILFGEEDDASIAEAASKFRAFLGRASMGKLIEHKRKET